MEIQNIQMEIQKNKCQKDNTKLKDKIIKTYNFKFPMI